MIGERAARDAQTRLPAPEDGDDLKRILTVSLALTLVIGISLIVWPFIPPSLTSAGAMVVLRSLDGSIVSLDLPWVSGRPPDVEYKLVDDSHDPWIEEHGIWVIVGRTIDKFGSSTHNSSSLDESPSGQAVMRLTTNGTLIVVFSWTWRGHWDALPFGAINWPDLSLGSRPVGAEHGIELAVLGAEWSLGPFGYQGVGHFALTDTNGRVPSGRIGISQMFDEFALSVESRNVDSSGRVPLAWGEFSVVND